MMQVKPVDNLEKEGNWEVIDIFLFTNGQQYSPPRKYHLCVDELQLWDTTLRRLATSQFGSLHTALQLYTLDGHRVEGPLELKNGMAYVAVEPPDVFVDSGYEKYMIRATRSWEKRQAKKSNSIEVSPGSISIMKDGCLKSDVNASNHTIKPPEENFTAESVIHPKIKSPELSEIPEAASKLAPIAKPLENKRTSLAQRLTSFRKIGNPIAPPSPIKKTSIKTKESPPKKFTRPPVRTSTIPQPNNVAKSRIHAKAQETTPNTSLKAQEVRENSSISPAKISSNTKGLLTEIAPMENVIEDKEIILVSNIYKNPESEIKSMKSDNIVKEQVGIQYSPHIITIDEGIQSVIDETENIKERNIIHRDTIQNNEVKIVEAILNSNNTICENAVDSCIAFINEGDVVKLKLMIEVRNVDNRYIKHQPEHKPRSVANILKNDKESQNNLEDEVLIQSKSLQSVIEKECCQCAHMAGERKVVVVKCICSKQAIVDETTRTNTSSVFAGTRYFILLPRWKDKFERCNNNQERKQDVDENASRNNSAVHKTEPRNSSVINTLKYTYSEISLETLTNPRKTKDRNNYETEMHIVKNNSINPQTEHATNTQNGEITNNIRDEDVVTKQKVVTDNPTPARHSSQILDNNREHFQGRKSTLKEVRSFIDNAIQTDNSRLLLEAKRHEDGRYTFHLPSLHTLKCYNL